MGVVSCPVRHETDVVLKGLLLMQSPLPSTLNLTGSISSTRVFVSVSTDGESVSFRYSLFDVLRSPFDSGPSPETPTIWIVGPSGTLLTSFLPSINDFYK